MWRDGRSTSGKRNLFGRLMPPTAAPTRWLIASRSDTSDDRQQDSGVKALFRGDAAGGSRPVLAGRAKLCSLRHLTPLGLMNTPRVRRDVPFDTLLGAPHSAAASRRAAARRSWTRATTPDERTHKYRFHGYLRQLAGLQPAGRRRAIRRSSQTAPRRSGRETPTNEATTN